MTNSSMFDDEAIGAAPHSGDPASAMRGQTQSLYRKYRPQSFDANELVGQQHIVRTLQNALLLDRVAHAYLFCGPRGTGKTTTARLLAKAVNCLHPDAMCRPCNVCTSCVAITRGATADVIEIDAASNRGIDDIRDLRERVKYAPSQLRTKFYIIDEAHQITGPAANAFLKTLEEPPAHTKFVLATTDPEELLPTIISRCQRFDFRRVGLGDMVARLRTVATAEALTADDDALQTIARYASGSMRDALGLLDQMSVYVEQADDGSEERRIDTAAVLALLGVSRNERIEALVEALATKDANRALVTVNDAVEAGEDPRQLNRQLVAYLRVLLHQRAGGSPDADARAKAFAERFELRALSRLARIFTETDYKIRHSSYAQLPLELALVDAILSEPEPVIMPVQRTEPVRGQDAPPAAVVNERELQSAPPTTSLRDRLRGTATPGARPFVAPTDPPIPTDEPAAGSTGIRAVSNRAPDGIGDGLLSVEMIADLWPQIRGDVKAVNRRIDALLASSDPVSVRGNEITLASAYDFHRNKLNEDDVRVVVEEVIGRIVKQSVTISCVLRSEVATSGGRELVDVSAVTTTLLAQNGSSADGNANSVADAASLDEQRINAAKNIFDGEEIPQGR